MAKSWKLQIKILLKVVKVTVINALFLHNTPYVTIYLYVFAITAYDARWTVGKRFVLRSFLLLFVFSRCVE